MRLFAHARRHGLASRAGVRRDCSQASPVRSPNSNRSPNSCSPTRRSLRVGCGAHTELGGTRAGHGATSGSGWQWPGRSWTPARRCHHEP